MRFIFELGISDFGLRIGKLEGWEGAEDFAVWGELGRFADWVQNKNFRKKLTGFSQRKEVRKGANGWEVNREDQNREDQATLLGTFGESFWREGFVVGWKPARS